ncbi:hypothetical protein C356_04600 [Cryptococcus neoformans c45]|nr:hypothetical protein C356_04600 [Cryptococcus neoformans var. grubii c45]
MIHHKQRRQRKDNVTNDDQSFKRRNHGHERQPLPSVQNIRCSVKGGLVATTRTPMAIGIIPSR